MSEKNKRNVVNLYFFAVSHSRQLENIKKDYAARWDL